MLSKAQIDQYHETGAIVVPDILTPDEVAAPAPRHRRIRRTRPRRDGAQRDLRSRGQPHAGQPARPPHQDGASASSGVCAPGAPSEDPRRAAGPVGPGHPLRHRQAQHEVRRLRCAGGMAPGLGVLSAHQRRSRRGRRDVRRHGDGERSADDRARQPSRPDPRPPRRRRVLRRDGSREPRRRLRRGDPADRQGRLDHRAPRARDPRFGAERLRPRPPPAAVPVPHRRRLAAARLPRRASRSSRT